jgi:hypothetical protein
LSLLQHVHDSSHPFFLSILISIFFAMKASVLLNCFIAHVLAAESRWGPYIEFSSPRSLILDVETTVFAPPLPSPAQDALLLWTAMPTDRKERYQATIASYLRKRLYVGPHENIWQSLPEISYPTKKACLTHCVQKLRCRCWTMVCVRKDIQGGW